MFKKKYFFLLAAIMFSLVAFSCSSDSSGLKLSPSSLSFDKVNIGDLVTIDLVIENKYGKDVIISALDLVGHTDFTISAGLSLPYTLVDKTQVTITISYEPTVAGAQEAVLSIVHDGSTKPKDVKIAGEGVPVPRIRLSETTYDFGMSLISGSGVTHIFDIENIGTADMNITGLGFSGTNASSYSIVSGGNVPIGVTPGTKHQVEVKFFSPNVGIETATLEIAHDAVNEASPSTISLSADSVDRQGEIDLSVSNPWSFGAMPTGWTVVQPFEIENIGVAVLKVTSLTLQTGTDFSIVDVVDSNDVSVNLPVDLQIGDKIFVKVQFIAPGTSNYNDTLEIIHDGTNVSSPLDLKIEASGKTPTSKSFSYQGSVENWTVPAGVYLIKVTANGAGGGGTTGGKGGQIVAYAAVTPGDTLNIVVGGKGNNYVSEDRSANGGGGFSGVLDNANNHLVTAGGAGGTAGTDGSPYGAGGDGGGGNGGNGGCGQGGAGGINGPSPTGGVGGISGGNAGLPGTSVGGGNGGNGISNQASGGGGGGYGTGKGIGGTQYSVSGKGGDGGFGGGGGGGGGGWGSTNSRRSGGGGGGGGYAGGAGGTAPSGCSGSGGGGGGGGSNYADPAKATIITDTKGGGAARGTNGSVTIEY